MGFPAGYSDLMLPELVLNLFFLLGYLRRFICWAFAAAGLGDLLDSDAPLPPPTERAQPPLMEEYFPAARHEHGVGGECAVCLYELEAGEEVRRLTNCRHVYHRGCLDRWVEHEQSTCPLCRAPLFPRELKLQLAGGVEEVDEDEELDRFRSSFSASPPLFVPFFSDY